MNSPHSPSLAQWLQSQWRTRGLLAWALRPVAAVYAAATALRRRVYARGWRLAQTVDAPVVVVGNLWVGGAGKTPTVIAVVAALRRHGYTPGIVSRGYARHRGGLLEVTPDTGARDCGDEPALLARRTGAPVVVALDRVAAARALLQRHADVDVLVSDDGLQHLRLARQAQVLVFDERGVGNGWVLPSGPLREPLPRAVPPRTLVVYNAPQPSTPLTGTLARRSLAGVARLADWWRGAPAHPAALLALRGRTVRAVAGVAAPERFFQMLRAQGLSIDALGLPDHCDYAVLPWPDDGAEVVVTEKDAIKLDPARAGTSRVWVAPLDFALDAAFDAALLELLPPPGTRHGNTTA